MATQEQATPIAVEKERAGAIPAKAKPKQRIDWGKVGRYAAVVAVVLFSLAPFYWTVVTSVKGDLELNSSPPTLFPHTITPDNYRIDLFSSGSAFFREDLRNSAIIASITTILCLVFGSLCAYAIARLKFRGKKLVLLAVLSVSMFPFIALVGQLFVFFTNVNLYDTYVALIIPDLVITLPLTIWLLTSFFRDLPPDLEEAALVDGDTRLGALWHIVVPLTAPGVFAAAILSFISAWNDFLFGLTLTSSTRAQPVTVGVTLFNGEHQIPWGQIAAAAVIVTIPLVILVLFFQRRIVSGLTAGAVKG
ncbi:MAG: carbohydrate ABC transporter permease [Ktedonobacterales bacterium]